MLAELLLSAELATKREATISALAECGYGQGVTELHWLGSLSDGVDLRLDIGAFRAAVARFSGVEALLDPGPEPAAVQRLHAEFVAYWYFCMTLAEFFDAQLTAARMMQAEDPQTGFGSLTQLAKARQSFAVDPRLAWTSVSEFRSHWNMTVEPPIGPSTGPNLAPDS